MELIAPPPPELVGAVDPAARGAAPLLRPVAEDGDAPAAAVPFGLVLELLAAQAPAGQVLPAAGKDLPAPLLELSAATAGAPSATLPAPASWPLMGTAVAAGLRLDTAAAAFNAQMPAAALPGTTLPLASTPAAGVEPAAVPTALAQSLTAPTAAADLPVAPFGADVAPADGVPELPLPSVSREAVAPRAEPNLRPPPVLDLRAAIAVPTAPPAAGADLRAAAPPAEVATPVLRVVQRDGGTFTLRPVVPAADAAAAAPTDWLLPPGTQPATTAATASPATATLAQTGVDTNAPDWHEAFASRVQWLVGHRVGEAHIKLNPPELGAVDVKISLVDDQTFVQLTTATAGARDELAQSLPRLRELLSASGLELGGASVESGRGGRHEAGGYAAQSPVRGELDFFAPLRDDERSAAAPRRLAGRIDVFA